MSIFGQGDVAAVLVIIHHRCHKRTSREPWGGNCTLFSALYMNTPVCSPDVHFEKLTFIRPCGTHYLRTKGGAKAILQSLRSLKYMYGSPSDAGDAIPKGLNSSSLGYPAAG